jgi:ABC-type sugar transport system ATPase subunit
MEGAVLEVPPAILGSIPSAAVEAELGIRAENAQLATVENAHCVLEVDYAEPTGADVYLNGRIGGQPAVARVDRDSKAGPGDKVPLRWRLEAASVFDAATGARL